jgi:hypothetical protein
MVATTQVARSILQLATVATLSILGSGAGCAMGCTLVGCDSGLTVVATPSPVGPYRVEILFKDGTRRIWRCDRTTCGSAFFLDHLKSTATIEVIVGADTTRREVDGIQYQKSQPNGSKCDPTCYNSTVTIPLGP